MDTATPRPQSAFLSSFSSRRKGPITPLRIDTPPHAPNVALVSDPEASTCASALSSATSDADSFCWPPPSRPHSRNMKKLSLTLPSAQSSTASLLSPIGSEPSKRIADVIPASATRRRPSIVSLPNASTSSILHRKDEDGDGDEPGSAPYADGPVQILPGIWLGNEDNARDWRGLVSRGIKSILNVAKEVTCPIEGVQSHMLRSVTSHSDLKLPSHSGPTYHPPHVPSGRPAMHYLQMPWSHGQSDLVSDGFPSAMTFVDRALERGDGILIHCQCGVSRSATLVIALVMRAAFQCSQSVPPEVWALKSMHDAYSFVKEKSKWVGPNMSLIYQLLDYERALKPDGGSPAASEQSSLAAEEEWARRRQMVEDADTEDNDLESTEIMREARALDKAMEDRRVSRKSSVSSVSSTGIGMGQAWRSKYGSGRNRAGSIASIVTTGSVLSEHLVEEDEEQELLGVGGGFTETSCSSAEPTEDESSSSNTSGDADSPDSTEATDVLSGTPKAYYRTATHFPPSAPAHKASFNLPAVPATATATSFHLPKLHSKVKPRKRPPPLFGLLPPVPSSPVTPVPDSRLTARPDTRKAESNSSSHLHASRPASRKSRHHVPPSATPAQTLFVFPPSPTAARTPSTMTITSNPLFFKSPAPTPRVASFKLEGRRRSFIGVGSLATPTTACSRVDARGWVGMS